MPLLSTHENKSISVHFSPIGFSYYCGLILHFFPLFYYICHMRWMPKVFFNQKCTLCARLFIGIRSSPQGSQLHFQFQSQIYYSIKFTNKAQSKRTPLFGISPFYDFKCINTSENSRSKTLAICRYFLFKRCIYLTIRNIFVYFFAALCMFV